MIAQNMALLTNWVWLVGKSDFKIIVSQGTIPVLIVIQ